MAEKEQLSAMLLELRARCPTLCPAVVPAGCDDREHGTALLALSRDAQERQALVSLLSSARRAATRCALTDRETPEQELRFVAFWELNPASATYRLQRCAFVCSEAATLLDVSGFLQRFTKPGSDTAQLTSLANLFCLANSQAEQGAKALQARVWLQECTSLAYACQVVASSCASWTMLAPDGTRLSEVASLVALVRALLEGKGSAAAAAAAGAKTKTTPRKKKAARGEASDTPATNKPAATPTALASGARSAKKTPRTGEKTSEKKKPRLASR